MALKKKYCINLSGGYHHASSSAGGGFCIYADITLAAKHLIIHHKIKKILILDLDAHQGNGYQHDFMDSTTVFIVDFYNHNIYPGDSAARRAINVDVSKN
jgi:histone deacetylase 11